MTDTATLPPALRGGVQYRAAEVTAFQPEERIIELRAVPYETETMLFPGLFESFQSRAFAAAGKDPARVTLYAGHSNAGGSAVGRAMEVIDHTDHVFIRARVSSTAAGDDLLTLAGDGVLGEASIEFQPIPEQMKVSNRQGKGGAIETLVRHKRGHLLGVALVPHGAYGKNAPVLSVRDALSDKQREEWLARLRCRTA
jgi:phage head maturation protease